MQSAVRRMGNSSGVIIPKPLLAELGAKAGDAVDIVVEDGKLIIAPIGRHPRAGWAEASRDIAASGEQSAWPDFVEDADEDWTW